MANGLVFQNGAWTLQYANPVPTGFMAGVYGYGVDGDVTVTGTYTLTKETYFNNLTLTGTGTVKPAGYKMYVKGTLTINSGCSINDDGNAGSGSTVGASLALRGYLGAYTAAGGAGSAGNTNGTAGSNNTTYYCPYNDLGSQSLGGAGGAAGTKTGGAAGTLLATSTGIGIEGTFYFGRWVLANSEPFSGGGSGGGGASGNAGAAGGGGGSGGGIVWIAANNIVNNGTISANGGNGGNATGTAGATGSAGGGGGGGGSVVIITNTFTSQLGTIQANGGIGGSPIGTGASGSNGTSGSIYILSQVGT